LRPISSAPLRIALMTIPHSPASPTTHLLPAYPSLLDRHAPNRRAGRRRGPGRGSPLWVKGDPSGSQPLARTCGRSYWASVDARTHPEVAHPEAPKHEPGQPTGAATSSVSPTGTVLLS
jgi:hypothetical protein